jgi:hypothetical protein
LPAIKKKDKYRKATELFKKGKKVRNYETRRYGANELRKEI